MTASDKKIQQLFGLKWNPFTPDVPTEALCVTARLESFIWRVESLVMDGGFAALIGDPGLGKSTGMRLLADRLGKLRDVVVGQVTRPQAGIADFYRELGDLFGVALAPHNRWAGAKSLRTTWKHHIEASLFCPVLIFDEAQEACPEVLSELRLLCSTDFDSRAILTVVFAGNRTFLDKLRTPRLLPLDSRIRPKLLVDVASREELVEILRHALEKAGCPKLVTAELQATLVEHAAGNLRTLMQTANDLLLAAAQREAKQLDEKLFFDVFAAPASEKKPRVVGAAARR